MERVWEGGCHGRASEGEGRGRGGEGSGAIHGRAWSMVPTRCEVEWEEGRSTIDLTLCRRMLRPAILAHPTQVLCDSNASG